MAGDGASTDRSPEKPATTTVRARAGAERTAPRRACRKCGRAIEAADKFCPHCGHRQDPGDAWYYHPVWILVLAFVVLGPLALFLVWKSPKMGRTWKILMAVLILAYTGYCAYFAYQLTSLELRQLNELGDVMRQLESR